MNLLQQLPLRYLLLILIGGFAILISSFAYFTTVPVTLRNVERQAVERMTATLSETQGVLELLLRSGNVDGAKRVVASYGAAPGHEAMVLVDGNGNVLASTSIAEIGQPWSDAGHQVDTIRVGRARDTGAIDVELAADQELLIGYASVCGASMSGGLRPTNCGFLYYRESFAEETGTALQALNRQMSLTALGFIFLALLLWIISTLIVSRRLERLINTAQRFAAGDQTARARLSGADELAKIGQTLDSLLDNVVQDQSELRLRDGIVANSANGIVICDALQPDHPIIYCNPAFERITGYSQAETIGRNCRFLQGTDMSQESSKELRTALAEGRECSAVVKNYRKDGEPFWNELKISPVRHEGDITHFVGIQNDITKRHIAEQKLREHQRLLEYRVTERTTELAAANSRLIEEAKIREQIQEALVLSEERLRDLFDNAHDLIQSIAPDGTITYANRAWQEALGYREDQLEQLKIFDIVEPDSLPDFRQDFERLLAGEKLLALETRFQTSDGKILSIDGNATCKFKGGSPEAIRAILRDVTHRKRAEMETLAAKDDAERANKSKSMFLATASHDLRQPTQALVLLTGAIERSANDPEIQKIAAMQQEALASMTGLLNTLLDVSKLESAVVKPDIKGFAIAEVFERLHSRLQIQAEVKGLDLSFEESDAILRSDPGLVEQIIQNLVGNAIRYTKMGSVRVCCQAQERSVRIDVIDTGIGIPSTELAHIFDEFHQVRDNPTRQSNEGLGLGLSIVDRLGKLLGTTITAVSTVGEGSTFSFDVPTGQITDRIAEETTAQVPVDEIGEAAVLLIEDDEAVRNSLKILLEIEGFNVREAASGDEAETQARLEIPDMIVSDFHLQRGESGIEAIRRIRTFAGQKIPAILVSGDTSSAIQLGELDASHLLSKPVDVDNLLALLRQIAAEQAAANPAPP